MQHIRLVRTVLILAVTLTAGSCWQRRPRPAAGGIRLLYQINVDDVDPDRRMGLTERTMKVVRLRLDPEGVRELTVRPVGEYRFEVLMAGLPGADDQEMAALLVQAKRILGRSGRLEFRLLADDETERTARETGEVPDGCKWYPVAKDAQDKLDSRAEILVRIDDGFDLTGSYLDSVAKGLDDNMRPAVRFTFNDSGGRRFGRLTGRNVGKRLAIILDGQVHSAPVIKSRIESRGIIEGGRNGFSVQEQEELIAVLNAGSLEAGLTLLREEIIGGGGAERGAAKTQEAPDSRAVGGGAPE